MRTFSSSRFTLLILVAILAVSVSNCSIHRSKASYSKSTKAEMLPPGQAKKISGDRNAKRYAPGQNK